MGFVDYEYIPSYSHMRVVRKKECGLRSRTSISPIWNSLNSRTRDGGDDASGAIHLADAIMPTIRNE